MKNKKFLSLGVATLLIGMVLTGCVDQLLEDSNLIKTAVDSGKYQLSTGEVTYQK